MNDVISWRSLEDLVEEGERLLKGRPFCRKIRDDMTAATLICKMHAQGFDVSIDDADRCVQRMRIAIDTGIYPDALLQRAVDEQVPFLV